MTITLELNEKKQVKDFKLYLKELNEFIQLDKDVLPATMTIFENTITIYMTDKFFEYAYRFFMDRLVYKLNLDGNSDIVSVGDDFRQGAKDILMETIEL